MTNLLVKLARRMLAITALGGLTMPAISGAALIGAVSMAPAGPIAALAVGLMLLAVAGLTAVLLQIADRVAETNALLRGGLSVPMATGGPAANRRPVPRMQGATFGAPAPTGPTLRAMR